MGELPSVVGGCGLGVAPDGVRSLGFFSNRGSCRAAVHRQGENAALNPCLWLRTMGARAMVWENHVSEHAAAPNNASSARLWRGDTFLPRPLALPPRLARDLDPAVGLARSVWRSTPLADDPP